MTAWDHPVFRVRRKTFVAFEVVERRPTVAFRLGRPAVDALLRHEGFVATPYGRGLWASAWVDRRVDVAELTRLAEAAYRTVAGVRLTALADAQLAALGRARNRSGGAPRPRRRISPE